MLFTSTTLYERTTRSISTNNQSAERENIVHIPPLRLMSLHLLTASEVQPTTHHIAQFIQPKVQPMRLTAQPMRLTAQPMRLTAQFMHPKVQSMHPTAHPMHPTAHPMHQTAHPMHQTAHPMHPRAHPMHPRAHPMHPRAHPMAPKVLFILGLEKVL